MTSQEEEKIKQLRARYEELTKKHDEIASDLARVRENCKTLERELLTAIDEAKQNKVRSFLNNAYQN